MNKKTKNSINSGLRDIVFGLEDGMVSTLGAITGIAIGSNNPSFVLLSGCVVIAVESVSMGIGSYLSNQSEQEMKEQILAEERNQINDNPIGEQKELIEIYTKEGWPQKLATEMSKTAFKNKDLFFKEMAHHELSIIPGNTFFPFKNGLYMFFSYIVGGLVPLLAYIFFPISVAIIISILITLISLFVLGSYVGKYIKVNWLRSGIRMLLLAGIAILIGYIVGTLLHL